METYDPATLKDKMQKAVAALTTTFQGIRTGRANPGILDRIKAEVYGTFTPIQQLATISTPEPRVILVQVWDKEAVKPLERSIRESSLGLNPQIEGNVLRIILPELTQERREELTKYASKCTEETKIGLRNIRHDAVNAVRQMEKNKDITEDDRETMFKEIQKITDQYTDEVEKLLEAKKKDIMSV